MSRCFCVRFALVAIFGLLGTCFAAAAVRSGSAHEEGYGRCTRCSCPGFTGSGYTCTRGGCRHHYDSHW